MVNVAWGVNLPPRENNVIALDYGVRIVGYDEQMANFIYAVKTLRDYAKDYVPRRSPTDALGLHGLRESKDFVEDIRRMAKPDTVINMTVTMPVGSAYYSRERSTVALCGVLGTLGIAFHITSVTERFA